MPGESTKAAAKAVNENGIKPKTEVTLSNGVVLGLKAVPPWLIRRALLNLEEPKPPIVYLEDKGREEENPGDPAYIAAQEKYQSDIVETSLRVMLGAGTYIKSIPKDMSPPESDEWQHMAKSLGIELQIDTPIERYLEWLYMYAISSTDDMRALMNVLGDQTGIKEEEVDDAVTSFPGKETRRADRKLSSKNAKQRDNL